MLLSEKAAGEKFCPMTLAAKTARCVASGCMAWRWVEYTPHVCDKCGTEETEWVDIPEQRRGYCGMAGISKF